MTSTTGQTDGPDLRRNPIRSRLAAGEAVVGLTITTNNLEAAALGTRLGFHFLWVEMEHSPVSLETLRAIVLATSGKECAVFARVPTAELWTAKRVLDQGVSGVMFPFASTAETARTAALACRYPPAGRRGSGARLAASTWFEPGVYYDSADAQILTICVIEEERALAEIDAIAATPGVDVLFIGTSDLSFSLGLRGRQDDPRLQSAIDTIAAAAHKHNKYLGRPAGTPSQIQSYREQGFQFFQSVTELGLMERGAATILGPLGIESSNRGKSFLY